MTGIQIYEDADTSQKLKGTQGEIIRELRKAAGITQRELAMRSRTTQQKVSLMELDANPGIEYATVERVFAGLGYEIALTPTTGHTQSTDDNDAIIGMLTGMISAPKMKPKEARAVTVQYGRKFDTIPEVEFEQGASPVMLTEVSLEQDGFTIILYNWYDQTTDAVIQWTATDPEEYREVA